MKSSCVLLVLLFLATIVPAVNAQSNLDSLTSALQTTESGPEKYRLYGKISWAYIENRQLEEALTYADSMRLDAVKIKDSSGQAYAQFYYGAIARHRGQYTTALDHLQNFVEYYTTVGDCTKVSHGLFQIGNIHHNIGNYEKSLKALYRALRIHEFENDQSSINFALNSIGVVLRSAKRYDEALENYHRALSTDSTNSDVLMNIGNIYTSKNELNRAAVYYRKALRIDERNKDDWAIAYDLENLGNLFNAMEMHDSALVYHSRALSIRGRLSNKREEALSLSQLGYTNTKLRKNVLAKDYLTRALALAKETGSKILIRDIYEKLSLLYSENRDYGNAYTYLKSYTGLKDSILDEESVKQLNELTAKYETEKKEQQITLLSKEKELQAKETQRQATLKNAFIGGSVLISLLAILFFYTFRQRLKSQKVLASKNEEIRDVNFKRQLTELEMKALQAQINPHFIFNCMNSINEMILDGQNESASKYLTKFSKLIRLILENAESTEVALNNELAMLEAYIQLEALRFKGEIKYELEVGENIDPENTYIPSMVLQPFVENAIWHGLLHKKDSEKGKISITIAHKGDQIFCQIEDNGVGREKAFELRQKSLWKSKSLGLKITEERLNLLSREFKKRLINITDLKDMAGQALGTRVEVSIPIG